MLIAEINIENHLAIDRLKVFVVPLHPLNALRNEVDDECIDYHCLGQFN